MSLLTDMESAVPVLRRLYSNDQLDAETLVALRLAIAIMKVEITHMKQLEEKLNIGSEARREEEREIMKSRGEL